MATKIEIANRLAKDFIRSISKEEGASKIISELNSLTYEGTNNNISAQDKIELINLIGEFISGKRPFQYRDGGTIILSEQKDNSNYLDVIDYIFVNIKK